MTLAPIFLILALLCFLFGAANFPEGPRPNMIALGLAFLTLSMLVAQG